jgi:hypothetical protein
MTSLLLRERGMGLAVPLRAGKRVLGAVSVRYFRSAMSETEAVRRFLGPLQAMGAQIGQELQRANRAGTARSRFTRTTP